MEKVKKKQVKEFQKINKPYQKFTLTGLLLEIAATSGRGFANFYESFEYKTSIKKILGKTPYEYIPDFWDRVSQRSIDATASRLKNQGYLEKIVKKGKTYYRITEKGRTKISKFLFDRQKWDGYWRTVVFDLPEELKNKRAFLRNNLKRFGFKQLQKSVWLSPFENLGEVEIFLKEYNLLQYTWCFLSRSFENDEEIIEKFLENEE